MVLFLKVQKKYRKQNSKTSKRKNEKMMLSSKCAMSGSTKLRLIKEQETSKILDNILGTKILVLGDILIANILI